MSLSASSYFTEHISDLQKDMELDYKDVFYFTEEHWLSMGNFFTIFLKVKSKSDRLLGDEWVTVPVLHNPKWIMHVFFLVIDIIHELNILNKKLQGQGQFIGSYDNMI